MSTNIKYIANIFQIRLKPCTLPLIMKLIKSYQFFYIPLIYTHPKCTCHCLNSGFLTASNIFTLPHIREMAIKWPDLFQKVSSPRRFLLVSMVSMIWLLCASPAFLSSRGCALVGNKELLAGPAQFSSGLSLYRALVNSIIFHSPAQTLLLKELLKAHPTPKLITPFPKSCNL